MLKGTIEECLITTTGAKYVGEEPATVTAQYDLKDLYCKPVVTYVDYNSKFRAHPYACRQIFLPEIKKVVFNDPATIILWSDGKKTVVKVHDEPYDKEKGFAMALIKKAYGDEYHKLLKEVLNDQN